MAVPPGLRSDLLQLYAEAARNAIDWESAAIGASDAASPISRT
jgi:hypothetical protein